MHATSDAHLPLIKWLVKEQGHDAAKCNDLELTLKTRGFKAATYLVEHGARIGTTHVYVQVASGGAWDVLDFLRLHFPAQYSEACRQWPLIAVRHEQRPKIRFHEYVNLDDPNGPIVCEQRNDDDDDDDDD